MATDYQIDLVALKDFLGVDREQGLDPGPRAVLEPAYDALWRAGVLKSRPGSDPLPEHATFDFGRSGLTQTSPEGDRFWANDRLPRYDGLLTAIAYHLAAVLNEPNESSPGPFPGPPAP